jgi:hypothetical protein
MDSDVPVSSAARREGGSETVGAGGAKEAGSEPPAPSPEPEAPGQGGREEASGIEKPPPAPAPTAPPRLTVVRASAELQKEPAEASAGESDENPCGKVDPLRSAAVVRRSMEPTNAAELLLLLTVTLARVLSAALPSVEGRLLPPAIPLPPARASALLSALTVVESVAGGRLGRAAREFNAAKEAASVESSALVRAPSPALRVLAALAAATAVTALSPPEDEAKERREDAADALPSTA